MRRWSTGAKLAAGGWLGLTVALLLTAWNVGTVVRWAMTPKGAFSGEAPPSAPHYLDAREWSALPEREDLSDRDPSGWRGVDPWLARADVFYVHPTSYVGDHWNAPIDDAALNEATDRVATGIQASAFNGCCAVYAPRYRQANGTAFYASSPDGDRAIALAYDDVRRAFEAFNARRDPKRPFILAAHSQGAVLAERLLYEAVSGTPLRDRLVAAYLIGGRVTEAGLRAHAPDVPPCRAPDDLHCVVAWNARGPHFRPNAFELRRPSDDPLLCTNPLSWRLDGASAPAEQNLGAVFLESDDPSPREGFADARCSGGILVVSKLGFAPRDLASRVLDHVLGPENYHPIEYQLFFMNLRANAAARVAAYVAAQPAKASRSE